MPNIDDIPECLDELLPEEDWIRESLFAFSELRLSMQMQSLEESSKDRKVVVPQLKDRSAWYKFCLGDKSRNVSSPCDLHDEVSADAAILNSIDVQKKTLARQFDIVLTSSCSSEEDIEDADEPFPLTDEIEEEVEATSQWQGETNVSPSTALMVSKRSSSIALFLPSTLRSYNSTRC